MTGGDPAISPRASPVRSADIVTPSRRERKEADSKAEGLLARIVSIEAREPMTVVTVRDESESPTVNSRARS